MAVVDSKKKEINFKIVYYGPALSGKSTSLEKLQALVKSQKKTKVTKHSTERTLFFDFLALSSDAIGGYKTRFQVYTVPGQVLYENSRKLLLKGVDGIIFVADSQLEKLEDNLKSLQEMRNLLSDMQYTPGEIPMVIQYNKRDLPGVPAADELRRAVNLFHVPDFETVATEGKGIIEAFREVLRQVVLTLKEV